MKKLSDAQLRMLRGLRDHGSTVAHLHGRSSRGGASATRASLQRAGLIEATFADNLSGWSLTATGKAAIE